MGEKNVWMTNSKCLIYLHIIFKLNGKIGEEQDPRLQDPGGTRREAKVS